MFSNNLDKYWMFYKKLLETKYTFQVGPINFFPKTLFHSWLLYKLYIAQPLLLLVLNITVAQIFINFLRLNI